MIKFKDNLVKLYVYFSIVFILLIIFFLLYFIFIRGLFEVDLEFLLDNPKGTPLGSRGGVKGAILGSFLLMIISTTISMIFGTCCAIYNKVFCSSNIIQIFVKFVVRTISSIPSLILGLFVYGFFIVTLDIQRGLLTASIALAMMTFAFVEIHIEKAIDEVDKNSLRDSLALGVNKVYMARKLIIPLIKRKMGGTFILAGSYAMGATAPLILTGVVFITNSSGLFSPVMALPFHLHSLLTQSANNDRAYATSFVLIMILILLHIVSEIILKNLGGRFVEYIRNKRS